MAIAGLVLGIVALATGWLSWFSLITLPVAIVALVLSAVGGKKAKAAGKKSGVATAGVVIGIIAVVLNGIWFFSCGLCALCLMCGAAAL